MILIPESGCAVVKVQGHLGNAGSYKAMRIYSLAVLAIFVWKMTILFGPQMITLNESFDQLILPYLAPAKLPLWQLAAAVNAVFAWVLYFLADKHFSSIRAENPKRTSDEAIKLQIGFLTFIRNTVALYAIACTFYITWTIAVDIEFPAVEFILFPWSRQ